MCHCGLFINRRNSHYAYIDFCNADNEESLFYENNFELRYYNSETKINSRVNCVNYIKIDNITQIENEWLNVSSNIDDDTFKCARISNNEISKSSSSYLIRINDSISVRYDIDFDPKESKGKIVLKKISIKINENIENNNNDNFGGLCGNFASNALCANYAEDANKCENNANVLYDYWQ